MDDLIMFKVPEKYRLTDGPMGSTKEVGNNGVFVIPASSGIGRRDLFIIASDGEGWEHVSLQASEGRKSRTPTWDEMCAIKDMFWGPNDWVVQFHPAQKDYVNNHENVLHLWRPVKEVMPTPPSILVGIVTPTR